jgi:hypothetical protein
MGSVTGIPAGFALETVVVLSSGINTAMDAWGDVLLARSGKQRTAYRRDFATQNLGFSTGTRVLHTFVYCINPTSCTLGAACCLQFRLKSICSSFFLAWVAPCAVYLRFDPLVVDTRSIANLLSIWASSSSIPHQKSRQRGILLRTLLRPHPQSYVLSMVSFDVFCHQPQPDCRRRVRPNLRISLPSHSTKQKLARTTKTPSSTSMRTPRARTSRIGAMLVLSLVPC